MDHSAKNKYRPKNWLHLIKPKTDPDDPPPAAQPPLVRRGLQRVRRLFGAPPPPPPPPPAGHPAREVASLAAAPWYWGPLSKADAERRLQHRADGAFLVRDSAAASCLFSLSFRSGGRTLHARLAADRGRYSLFGAPGAFRTVGELVADALRRSEAGALCHAGGALAVRLTQPVSRRARVQELRALCRFVIRQRTNLNEIERLPLPAALQEYLREGSYFYTS